MLILAYMTTQLPSSSLGALVEHTLDHGLSATTQAVLEACTPTIAAVKLLLVFNALALLLYLFPGKPFCGTRTESGVLPEYVDNGIAHCILFTVAFLAGSDLCLGWYKLSVLFDHYAPTIGFLNAFGLAFCFFLYLKGLYAPSGPDAGTSGHGIIFDYYWGTELYPRIAGVDVKKFVNCRFSMTYWMLAGVSFAAASYERHGKLDPGLCLCALSQFIYLVKFFVWEVGYMRSIDIIVDRAGFYETWGCLVFVPTVYTLHTRAAVLSPSGLDWPTALVIFTIGLIAVGLNFWADDQRLRFRERDGKGHVWGRKPTFIEAQYEAFNRETGKREKHRSLLLASGWWGVARHVQYAFELTAAYSWALLAGVGTHGPIVLLYPLVLTVLLIHRAGRDEQKCLAKYGSFYRRYMELVPYKIVPGIF